MIQSLLISNNLLIWQEWLMYLFMLLQSRDSHLERLMFRIIQIRQSWWIYPCVSFSVLQHIQHSRLRACVKSFHVIKPPQVRPSRSPHSEGAGPPFTLGPRGGWGVTVIKGVSVAISCCCRQHCFYDLEFGCILIKFDLWIVLWSIKMNIPCLVSWLTAILFDFGFWYTESCYT